jgi:hypothetical protein
LGSNVLPTVVPDPGLRRRQVDGRPGLGQRQHPGAGIRADARLGHVALFGFVLFFGRTQQLEP